MNSSPWLTVILPTVFASLGFLTWVTGIMLNDKAGGQSLSTQLVTLAAAAWQKEKNEGVVRANQIDNVNVSEEKKEEES